MYTVYQRSPDIAISEVYVFLQGGSHFLSVFLDCFSRIWEFSVEAYISEVADILMYIYDCKK